MPFSQIMDMDQRWARGRASAKRGRPQAQNFALKTMNEAQISPPKAAKILKKLVFLLKNRQFFGVSRENLTKFWYI